MRIKTENEILDPVIRKRIIEEIKGQENQLRKNEAYKRHVCYKDGVKHYVVDFLLRQFEASTVQEMRYALSNISIVKKVVDKLARVYSNGVERAITNSEEDTEKLKDIEKKLDVNSAMKKANRFLKLQKNVDLFVKPCPVKNFDGTETKWAVKLEVLPPYLYDVVEDYDDRSKSMCVILSDFDPPTTALEGFDGQRAPVVGPSSPATDGKDNTIADNPADQNKGEAKKYIFWSKNYHFTCDENGQIIFDEGNPENKNPLGVFNHINFAIDQDGAFWAEGGDDLIDGAILINALITHTLHVGVVQGYGQFYMTGENLPRSIKVGPTRAIIAEYKKDEQAEPKMGFLNASPQLDSLRGLVEMYIALYLTTNNLSTSGVSTQLAGGNTLPSGVALILDKAESLEDVQDQRQVFIDKEPDIFEAINSILTTYGDNDLIEELKGLSLSEGFKENFVVKFNDPSAIISEKEKLENLKLRHEMGLDSLLSMIMRDDPTLDETQAEQKLIKLIEQRIKEKLMEQEAMEAAGIEYEDPNAQNPQNKGAENAKEIEDPKDPEDIEDETEIQQKDVQD